MADAIVCPGSITTDATGAAFCLDGWQPIIYSSVVPFDISMITPQDLAVYFGSGFFLALPVYAAAFGAGQLIKLVR